MDTTIDRDRTATTGVPAAARLTMALSAAVLAGALTSFGQAVPGLGVLANSAGPWFAVAVLLVLVVRVRGVVLPMVLGVVVLELMHVGYWATTNLRGYPDFLSITNFWVLIGVPAGLLAGAVAWALRSGAERWRAAAAGVGAAVLVGEGVRGLQAVAATTGTGFWTVEIVVGVAVLLVGVLTCRTIAGRLIALGTGVVGTAGVTGAYLLLG
ncbi:hypothetical protein Csp2054_01910 [Curtobacterium sp. 'Ferrero']|uniref:DUF6518 family protein n=1 Tax=Curtobacterium sp. 'Ferrero' TaxID=2033654 RepID=UPI000BDD1EC6|nr:DUF6518 family protein [Curtobacterium sp. 'Ferrero']PCN49715.1 hypothetical protein Csp2054_01910 [Curtobacterium sp. 'Ferrero']